MSRNLFIIMVLGISSASLAQKAEFHFQLDKYERTPILNVRTVTTFACSNNGIYIRQGWSRDTLSVKIIGIDSRKNCDNLSGVARETVTVNGIRSRHFILRFIWHKRINFFSVNYDGTSFEVSPEQSDFITFLTN